MRIVKPIADSKPRRNAVPQWLDALHRYSELKCGCIIERLPKCIARIAGNNPEVECEIHGFQKVKRDIPIREIVARKSNVTIDERLLPPF